MTYRLYSPGTRVGEYRLVRELGRGATGVVFQSEDAAGREVALKLLAPPALLTEEERESLGRRFLREARALAAVEHPNVVGVYASGDADGALYLAMELVQGENLRRLLARDGALAPEAAVSLALQLLAALDAVHHAGILHRDVKPENLVVLPDGTLKLTDFGVAWMQNEATLTRTGGVLGSPAYMSPEQILGRPVDCRSDLFSAAVTLYQLLSDRLPFPGENLVEMAHRVAYSEPEPLPSEVPYTLRRAVERAMQKTPAARYATATEFSQALRTARAPAASLAGRAAPDAVPSPDGVTATVADVSASCARHPRRGAIAHCRACSRPLCPACTRQDRPPHYCYLHAPVTLFGVSTVRLEVLLATAAFLLLLLCLSPLGYAALQR